MVLNMKQKSQNGRFDNTVERYSLTLSPETDVTAISGPSRFLLVLKKIIRNRKHLGDLEQIRSYLLKFY